MRFRNESSGRNVIYIIDCLDPAIDSIIVQYENRNGEVISIKPLVSL
jgi:hypothetical protein